MRCFGVQLVLYLFRIRTLTCGPALLAPPVLHNHGNARGATTVSFLLHKRDIQPDPGGLTPEQNAAQGKQHDQEFLDIAAHDRCSMDRNNDKNQSRDHDKNDDQITLAEITSREVGLCLARTGGKLGELLVTQA
jgi:hypothetical protein